MTTPRGTALGLTCAAALAAAAITAVAATSQAAAPPTATRTIGTADGFALAYATKRLAAPAGRVTLRMRNRGDIAHNVAVRGKKLAVPRVGKIVGAGGLSVVTARLKPGRYTYYCTVFGHEAGGMRGTLTVRAR